MTAMDIEEQQLETITVNQKEATRLYSEFGLREIYRDNYQTENLCSISFCPKPWPYIVAVTASNHISVFDLAYRSQWLGLQLKFVNGCLPLTTRKVDQIREPKEKEVLSFSWLGHQPFRALAGTREGEIKRFQLEQDTQELKPFTEKHTEAVTTIVGFMDGKYAVSLSRKNGEVRVWDCENPEACLHRELIADAVWLTPSIDDQSVLIVRKSSIQALRMQKLDAGFVTARIDIILDGMRETNGRLQICKSLSPDEVVLVSVRRSVSVWNLKSKSRVAIWQSSEKTNIATSFDVCRTTGVCVLGCAEGAIEIRDVYSGLLHNRIGHHRIGKNISFTHVRIAHNGLCILAGAGSKVYKFSNKYNHSARSKCDFVEQ